MELTRQDADTLRDASALINTVAAQCRERGEQYFCVWLDTDRARLLHLADRIEQVLDSLDKTYQQVNDSASGTMMLQEDKTHKERTADLWNAGTIHKRTEEDRLANRIADIITKRLAEQLPHPSDHTPL